jgi:hypothetical protein
MMENITIKNVALNFGGFYDLIFNAIEKFREKEIK